MIFFMNYVGDSGTGSYSVWKQEIVDIPLSGSHKSLWQKKKKKKVFGTMTAVQAKGLCQGSQRIQPEMSFYPILTPTFSKYHLLTPIKSK